MPSAKVYRALVTLSDPAAHPADSLALQLNDREIDSLLKLADRHTVRELVATATASSVLERASR